MKRRSFLAMLGFSPVIAATAAVAQPETRAMAAAEGIAGEPGQFLDISGYDAFQPAPALTSVECDFLVFDAGVLRLDMAKFDKAAHDAAWRFLDKDFAPRVAKAMRYNKTRGIA